MSSFCGKCGTAVDDGVAFCPNCGTSVGSATVATDSATPVSNEVPAYSGASVGSTLKSNKKMISLALAAVAVLIVIVLIFSSLFGGSKTAVSKAMKVMCTGKSSNIRALAPDEYWDYVADQNDKSRSEIIDDAKDGLSDYKDDIKDEDVKLSYKILSDSKEKLSSDKLDDIKEYMDETYDIPEKKVTAAYTYTVKFTRDEESQSADITVVKIRGHWYAMSGLGNFMVSQFTY